VYVFSSVVRITLMSAGSLPNPSDQGTLDVTHALADPTRYGIYRSIVDAAGEPMTVLDVAQRFSLHPNVARMHLQKLVDVGLVQSDTRKSAGGGRPARIYRLGPTVTSIQFPPRDYQLLASLTLRVVDDLAGDGAGVLQRVGLEMGREEGRRALARDNVDPVAGPPERTLESLVKTCADLGLYPRIETSDNSVRVEIRNCVFRELSSQHPGLVCSMHTALLQGILEAYFGEVDLVAEPAISSGNSSCLFQATVPLTRR
jgi:predicted ArsR family transcriptional regulator